MPTRIYTVTFTLDDYFSKWGFGDGDDEQALSLGENNLSLAIQILNTELQKEWLPYSAAVMPCGGIHNCLRLCIRNYEAQVAWSANQKCLELAENVPGELVAKLQSAYLRAYDRFEVEASVG